MINTKKWCDCVAASGHNIQLCIVNDSRNWSERLFCFWLKIGLVHPFILNWYSLYVCGGWVSISGQSGLTTLNAIYMQLYEQLLYYFFSFFCCWQNGNLDCTPTNKYAFIFGHGNQIVMVKNSIGTEWSLQKILFL